MKFCLNAVSAKPFVLYLYAVLYVISSANLSSQILYAQNQLAQSLFGLNLNDVNDTTGFVYNNSLDAAGTDVYLKNDPGIFDRILLHKGLGFDCTINYPNVSRFREVYNEIVKFCGYENEIKDKYAEDVSSVAESDDFETLTFLIFEGKAEVNRYWYEEKYNIKLEFSQKKFSIFISVF